MKQAAAHPTTSSGNGNAAFTAGSIASTFLDTTWRIAVPVVAGTLAGIAADRRVGTKPWLTLTGVTLGFLLAGWLVKAQLASVEMADTPAPGNGNPSASSDSEMENTKALRAGKKTSPGSALPVQRQTTAAAKSAGAALAIVRPPAASIKKPRASASSARRLKPSPAVRAAAPVRNAKEPRA